MANQYNYVLPPHRERQEILGSASYLLHNIDTERDTLDFLKTTRDTLSSTSFIDGRSNLSIDDSVWQVPIDEALQWQTRQTAKDQPNRFIFHTSFCGSTLLARSLNITDKALGLKEPNILVQLAELKAKDTEIYQDKKRWAVLVRLVLNQLGKQWSSSEAIVLKPSNWVNSMLSELIVGAGESRAVFLSSTPEQYLTAIFRGGGERVQFNYSLLKHMLTSFPEYSPLIKSIENNQTQTVDLFMRLSLIAYAIQADAFGKARLLVNDTQQVDISFDDLLNNPELSLKKATDALDLSLSLPELSGSIKENFKHHSKVTNRKFSINEMETINTEVKTQYGSNFDTAINWYRDQFEH